MNLCYLAKFGKNKFNLWHAKLGAIASGAHTVFKGPAVINNNKFQGVN